MKKVNTMTISSDNRKISVVVDGEKLDLHDVVSINIEIDCEGIKMITNKLEMLRLGD